MGKHGRRTAVDVREDRVIAFRRRTFGRSRLSLQN